MAFSVRQWSASAVVTFRPSGGFTPGVLYLGVSCVTFTPQVISLNGVKRPKLPDRPKQVTDAPPRYQYRTCPLGIPMSMSMYRFNIALLEKTLALPRRVKVPE